MIFELNTITSSKNKFQTEIENTATSSKYDCQTEIEATSLNKKPKLNLEENLVRGSN